MKTWHAWAFLIVAAVIWAYLGRWVLVMAAIYFLFRGWLWLCRRYPLLGWFIIGFIRGLMRR